MAQLLIRTVTGEYFSYETIASGAGPIRAELETAPSFLCRSPQNDADVLLMPNSIAWIFQGTLASWQALVNQRDM